MNTASATEPRLRVRSAEMPDLDSLLALYKHLDKDDPSASPKRYSEIWTDIIGDERVRVLIGELHGRPVSSCTLVLIPNLTRAARPYGLVENVVTHSEYRGRGFGSAVLREALRQAWEFDCYKVMLLTGSKREATLRFYESAGFRPELKTGFVAYPQIDR